MANVFRTKLSENVSRHLSSGLPIDSDPSRVDPLAESLLMDLNMAKLCLVAISVTLHKRPV
jgi:hypothetical protein